MCNPAEQSAGVDYPSDTKRINSFVSETDHLPICASTNAGTVVESNEASNHRSNDTLELSGGKVHNSGQGNVVNGSCCQKVAERLYQERELSTTCISTTPSFPADDGFVNESMHTPDIYVQDYPETSEHSFNSNVVNFKDDVHPSFAEDRRIETMPMDEKTLIEDTLSDTTNKWTEEVKLEKEALQLTRKGTPLELDTLAGISKEFPEQGHIKVVEIPKSTLVSCANELAVKGTEQVKIDSCQTAEETEMRMDMRHAGRKEEVDNTSLLVGLVGCSVDHSKGPCAETDDIRFGNFEETSSTKEHVPKDIEEPATWIEMRPGTSEGVVEQLAKNSEETPSGVMQIGMYWEEPEKAYKWIAAGSIESQNSAKEIELTYEQTGQVIKEIDEDSDMSIPGMAMSSEQAAAEQATISFEELRKNVVEQGAVFDETQSEIQQEGSIVSPVHVAATDSSAPKGINRPELADFFKNARGSKLEKEIEEQDHEPIVVKLSPKKKNFMESPRSLRMLLFSDETTLPIEKDEKQRKDGKGIEFSSKVALAAESNGNTNHTEDNYPTKWHENVDSADMSSDFSVPITFSGALTYQGMISYSGQVAYSGSISHRSDSSTSTRSFAFPILASDWNSSPVKMAAPDPRYFQQRRKWHHCFCCRGSSTLFD